MIYNKHTRELFQASVGRGNPNLITPVELEFSLPRNINLAQQCQVLINWHSSYKALSRQAHAPHLMVDLCSCLYVVLYYSSFLKLMEKKKHDSLLVVDCSTESPLISTHRGRLQFCNFI